MKSLNYSRSIHLVSLACVVHCIATPFLIVFTPFLGNVFESALVELSLLAISIFLGILIIYKGYCKYKKMHSFLLFFLGASLWVIHTLCEHYGLFGAKIYFSIGTGLVLVSYYINSRLLKCCPSDCSNTE